MPYSEPASPKPPLHKFPICDSRKVDDWSAATLPVFGPTRVEPQRGSGAFRALINLCPLQRTALCYGRFGGAFSVSVPESVSFVQGMPIRGMGEHINNGMKIPYSPRKGAVGAPGVLALSYVADLEIFAVFMKPDALDYRQGKLLRQRHGRDVLQDPQGRTRLAHHLPEPDRSRERNRRLHRRLLQSRPPPFGARLHQPASVRRAGSVKSKTLSTNAGQVQNWLHRPGAHLSELSADGREGRLAAARRVGEREVLWRCSNREIDERLFSLVRYPMCSSLRLSRAACHSTPQPEGMFRDIAAAHPPATQLVLTTLIGSPGATGG